ncbi:MAG: tRNA (N6-isopentenyl adenosine(37)-C2)-methylthiotransferase MiaB [Pirellulales bacterium]|nr:tRNA (N6-isopentenyl adenosine(37)-C2)-methylthiotransferase MiaB [Pirellulales bacterium]
MTKRFYIETVGCQMNVLDSELVASGLISAGYRQVSRSREADVVLFNTCSVRQHAEDKIYSALGRLKNVKDHYPHKVFAVIGCMAQKDGALIFRRAPHVDLVVGPSQLGRLPELVDLAAAGGGPQLEISLDRSQGSHLDAKRNFTPFNPERLLEARPAAHQAMVRIMFGCDMFCTYCIVPSVRGPEQSRPPEEIEAEVRQLARQAIRQGVCLEVTLLGQTVNSYRYHAPNGTVHLADLLYRLHDIEGLSRLKYVSNCPKFITQPLLRAVAELPKVTPYFHVPAQSGSNSVLHRMKRNYTVEQYREMLDRINSTVPGAAVTSDFIVGFCGETEEEFQDTMRLVREARFKNSFIFKYSTRPGTKAAELYEDDVPYKVKQRRNNELLALQNEITEELNSRLLRQTVEILVEGPSKVGAKQDTSGDKSDNNGSVTQLGGRTVCDRIVVLDGPRSLIGQIIPVKIVQSCGLTLFGEREV